MKVLNKNQMSNLYGGREVERSEATVINGTCYTDKIITKNDGTVKVKLIPCN